MSTTTRRAALITFEVWDFSTIDGGGHAVIREADWCEVAKRTEAERQGVQLGEGWHGQRTVLRRCWTVEQAEERYQVQFTVPVQIVRCGCGCLAGTTSEQRQAFRRQEHCGQEWCCG